MNIELLYSLQIHDKDGKLVKDTGLKKCDSLILQFMQLLEVQLYNDPVWINDTGGVSRASAIHINNFRADAAVGITDKGIRVGTGTTPVAYNNTALETPIANGTGATQLSHGATSKTATAHSGGNIDFILTRTFNNGSGSTINVTEVGVYNSIAAYYTCTLHEVFAAEAVLNTQTLTVNITFRVTV